MRSGAVPRTSNLMGAVSQLWNSLSPSQKQKYINEDENNQDELSCVYESLSPLKSSEDDSESSENLTSDKFDDELDWEITKKRKKSCISTGVPYKKRKLCSGFAQPVQIKIENSYSENLPDSKDTLKIFDETPTKSKMTCFDSSSRLNYLMNRRKRARKILDFDNLLDDERIPLCFEVPEVNVYTLLQDYDPPDDYTVPDVYDNEQFNYKWDYDEIANVEEADNSDYDPPKVPSKLRAFNVIKEPKAIPDKLPISVNLNELINKKEPVLNVTEYAFRKHSFPNQLVRLIHTPKATIANSSSVPKQIDSEIYGNKQSYKYCKLAISGNNLGSSKSNRSAIETQDKQKIENPRENDKDIDTIFQLFESIDSDKFISAKPAGNLVLRLSDGNQNNTIYKIPVVTSDGACKILSVLPKIKK